MKRTLMAITLTALTALPGSLGATTPDDGFTYNDEQFADIQMLRYRVTGFEDLTLRQKTLVYYLSEAALQGRDILFDQNGRYNLRIRRLLEAVYQHYQGDRKSQDFQALTTYLKRVWFSSGIHHHYGSEKFLPEFSQDFLKNALQTLPQGTLPLASGQRLEDFCNEIFPIMFDPKVMPMRVNQKDGEDLILTSAENYYGEGITQAEAEAFYAKMKKKDDPTPIMYGLNSRLQKDAQGNLYENVWKADGLYGGAIKRIIHNLEQARPYAESTTQQEVIDKLISYYRTGNLRTFDEYSIAWLKATADTVDFVNGFTETYGDPLGLKASWESIVNFKDLKATKRTEQLSKNAQWFENHSPVDPAFKKEETKGISAKVIIGAMLGGDLYPSTAIGINLPNADWVRRDYGSKSVTIGNFTDAYNKAAHGSGFEEEFVISPDVRMMIDTYGDLCDDLHTDLHECLGHGSGKLAPGTDPDALKAYGSTIEETRADLFGLYYLADPKLIELGLLPNDSAYQSQYYHYMMNGMLTQLVRIKPGHNIEEAHMRNRALIAWWAYEHGKAENVVSLVNKEGNFYVQVNDYKRLRSLFGQLLAEIQRIKSEGDFDAARKLIETYAVKVDPAIHRNILTRYERLQLSPYKGFINPQYELLKDEQGTITDVRVKYGESYTDQMLRYSRDYATLPAINE